MRQAYAGCPVGSVVVDLAPWMRCFGPGPARISERDMAGRLTPGHITRARPGRGHGAGCASLLFGSNSVSHTGVVARGRAPWAPPLVEMSGGVVGHLLAWEKIEGDGSWCASAPSGASAPARSTRACCPGTTGSCTCSPSATSTNETGSNSSRMPGGLPPRPPRVAEGNAGGGRAGPGRLPPNCRRKNPVYVPDRPVMRGPRAVPAHRYRDADRRLFAHQK